MHTTWRSLLLFGLLIAAPSTVHAQLVNVPQFHADQHVYTVPYGYRAPYFTPNSTREIESAARALHYPFYVIIAERLRGEDYDTIGGDAASEIAKAWTETSSDFDGRTSQVFLVATEPRAFGLLGGSKFKTEIGFSGDALTPYTDRFIDAMRSEDQKDPVGGIIAMMRSADAHLFDQTDPATVAARAEAGRIAAEQRRVIAAREAEERRITAEREEAERRLATARGTLDENILTLTQLLSSPKAYLPPDTSSYRSLLAKAKQVRAADKPEEMAAFAASMRSSVDVLGKHVRTKESAATAAKVKSGIVTGTFIGIVLGLLVWFFLRRRTFVLLQADVKKDIAALRDQLTQAGANYATFHTDRQEKVEELGELQGDTLALHEEVNEEINAIYDGIAAMRAHAFQCEQLAATANFFSFAPIRKAKTDLASGTVEFDTKKAAEGELFNAGNRVVTVDVASFMPEMAARYTGCIHKWKYLLQSLELVKQRARDLFPHAKLDEMLATAQQYGIPARWLHEHPLFGDDAADEAVYARLDAHRADDQVAFAKGLDGLRATEKRVQDLLATLVSLLSELAKTRIAKQPVIEGCNVDPTEDPVATFQTAQREDAALMSTIASSDHLEEIHKVCDRARELYIKCATQVATIEYAKLHTAHTVDGAREMVSKAGSLQATTQTNIVAAQRVFSNLNTKLSYDRGLAALNAAKQELDAATTSLASKRLLAADRSVITCSEQVTVATRSFDEAQGVIIACEEKRDTYLKTERGMASARSSADVAIASYGESTQLTAYVQTRIAGPANYDELLAGLVTLKASWALAEKKAREAHEERERRRRLAEEAERRRLQKIADDAAAEKRRAEARRAEASRPAQHYGGGGRAAQSGRHGGGGKAAKSGHY